MLLRLYDPTAGAITLDGVDLRDYDPADLRREVGAIFQDFVRYELTAGENIAMGQVDTLAQPTQLLEAATKAGAAELLKRLPQGLDTPLGRELSGRELSGGEGRRVRPPLSPPGSGLHWTGRSGGGYMRAARHLPMTIGTYRRGLTLVVPPRRGWRASIWRCCWCSASCQWSRSG
ncbi:MAG TPA: ABC transporter ATP-binding protein [Chloroflexota bacterium]